MSNKPVPTIPDEKIKQWELEAVTAIPRNTFDTQEVYNKRLGYVEGRKAQYLADHPEVPEDRTEVGKTQRGFGYLEFEDRYGVKFSLQKSSLATEHAIWLGCNEANRQIMGADGWEKYPIPEDVVMTTRMHLTQKQVRILLPHLQKFITSGEI